MNFCNVENIFFLLMVLFLQPPTEKVHQIIARTAMFVSKHGGQSEIVLRVKQGKNPAFGFLMPDDDLHPYFRFLVDHQELLQSEGDGKSQHERISDTKQSDGGGALSLLGYLYGYGEDEDGAVDNASVSKENMSGEPLDASAPISHGSEKTESPASTVLKDEAVSKHILPSKEKATKLRKSSKAGSSRSTKRDGESSVLLSDGADKLKVSYLPSISKSEPLIFEPPSDLKRLVEKIVEFIIKNGKQFEAVLVEQDSGHGRFPFLLPTNQYHPYYLKVLQKAQEVTFLSKRFVLILISVSLLLSWSEYLPTNQVSSLLTLKVLQKAQDVTFLSKGFVLILILVSSLLIWSEYQYEKFCLNLTFLGRGEMIYILRFVLLGKSNFQLYANLLTLVYVVRI